MDIPDTTNFRNSINAGSQRKPVANSKIVTALEALDGAIKFTVDRMESLYARLEMVMTPKPPIESQNKNAAHPNTLSGQISEKSEVVRKIGMKLDQIINQLDL